MTHLVNQRNVSTSILQAVTTAGKAALSPAPLAGVAAGAEEAAAVSYRAGEPRVPSAPHSGSGVSARTPASADFAEAASAPPSLGVGALVFTLACAAGRGVFTRSGVAWLCEGVFPC